MAQRSLPTFRFSLRSPLARLVYRRAFGIPFFMNCRPLIKLGLW